MLWDAHTHGSHVKKLPCCRAVMPDLDWVSTLTLSWPVQLRAANFCDSSR
jgi:hypothetical protein